MYNLVGDRTVLISEGLKMMRKLWKRIEELSEEKQQTEAE